MNLIKRLNDKKGKTFSVGIMCHHSSLRTLSRNLQQYNAKESKPLVPKKVYEPQKKVE